jgi:ornithine carbamoyltransferase
MITGGLKRRDFLRLQDFSKAEFESMLELGLQLTQKINHMVVIFTPDAQ